MGTDGVSSGGDELAGCAITQVLARRVVTAVASMEGALASPLRPSPVSPPPSAAGPPPSSEKPPVPPELPASPPSWTGLDRLGLTQAIGGHALGLIALFSSYDHLTIAGEVIPIHQQWGIPLIAASVAKVFAGCVQYGAPRGRDAQLATGSRLRAADERKSDRDRAEQRENQADRERNRADQERNRAAEARERQAEAAERQREGLERIHQTALLSARVHLDPSDTNRARLQAFLTLLNQTPDADSDL